MRAFRWKRQIACIAIGIVLGALAQGAQSMTDYSVLERPGYGQESRTQTVLVDGLTDDGNVVVEVEVSKREYTQKEAEQAAESAVLQLSKEMLGDNVSPDAVCKPLNLVSNLDGYGFRILWESSDSERIDALGNISLENLGKEGEDVVLTATLESGTFSQTFAFPVRVREEEKSAQEAVREAFAKNVKEEDLRQRTTPQLRLPDTYEGHALTYRDEEKSVSGNLVALGVIAALLICVQEKSRKKEEKKKRETQLILDYPEMVSKLMIFLGAGMTLKTAWDRIGADYKKRVLKENGQTRPVYEEMVTTSEQMRQGVAEGKAYEEFGRRCGVISYIRLCSLLEQNRRNGSKNLKELLRLEMAQAFEMRKHQARRLGEEAGTKLLLPLFLLLGMVMVMVAVPAMLEFL